MATQEIDARQIAVQRANNLSILPFDERGETLPPYEFIERILFYNAAKVVGLDPRRQLAHIGYQYVDIHHPIESRYSGWEIIEKDGRPVGIGMVRFGVEHGNRRRFLSASRDVVETYLATLAEQIGNPNKIPLVVSADDFSIEELNKLFNGKYTADLAQSQVIIRVALDRESFERAPVPSHPPYFSFRRLRTSLLPQREGEAIKAFHKQNNPNSSFKLRSLDTGGYFDVSDLNTIRPGKPEPKRIAMAGITAQVAKAGMIPFSLAGDLVVAEEYRGRGIATAVRWQSLNWLFRHPTYRDGIVAGDIAETNEVSRKIWKRLNAEEVSRSLWVMMVKSTE